MTARVAPADVDAAAERAAAFLAAGDDPLLAAWAPVLLGGGSGQAAAEIIVKSQRADGSFGDLAATRRTIALLDDAGSRSGEVLEGACRWLERSQSLPGSWGAAEEEALFETGVLTGILARAHCAPAGMLGTAADWLAERFDPDRVKFRWRPLAAYAASFSNFPHEAGDGILQWCGRELERGVLARRFDAVQVCRLLVWCDAPSLPGGKVSAAEMLPALVAEQEPDGSYRAGGEPAVARQATWDALVALLRLPR